MKLIFATQNQHKKDEVAALLSNDLEIISLNDLNFKDELAEPFFTLEENAAAKAAFIYLKFKASCFAEDSGLEIEALGGDPGVYSARYAGPEKNPLDNIMLVLEKMKEAENRKARFKAVICLVIDAQHFFFTGIVNGTITREIQGSSAFGYDPIFIPEGEQQSFAEMTQKRKNAISHRSKAICAMKRFLDQLKE